MLAFFQKLIGVLARSRVLGLLVACGFVAGTLAVAYVAGGGSSGEPLQADITMTRAQLLDTLSGDSTLTAEVQQADNIATMQQWPLDDGSIYTEYLLRYGDRLAPYAVLVAPDGTTTWGDIGSAVVTGDFTLQNTGTMPWVTAQQWHDASGALVTFDTDADLVQSLDSVRVDTLPAQYIESGGGVLIEILSQ